MAYARICTVDKRNHGALRPGQKIPWGDLARHLRRICLARKQKTAAARGSDQARTAAPAIVQPSIEINGRVMANFADYDGLWKAVRARIDAMGVTRLELDYLSSLQEGYHGKLLGPGQIKKFSKDSLGQPLAQSAANWRLSRTRFRPQNPGHQPDCFRRRCNSRNIARGASPPRRV